jgi:hypothetical protein
VVSTVPAQGADDVGQQGTVRVIFSEAMEPATIGAATFALADGGSVPGTVSYDVPKRTAIFAPDDLLAVSTEYTATITTGAKDLAGNSLAAAKVWTFTTAPPGAGPAPVLLGSAANFVILAKSAVSTVPASVITGNVGLSPAAESYFTGFSQTDGIGYATSPQVTGFLYAATMAPPTPTLMTTAVSDLETAYTDAAGRSLDAIALAADIGGSTLAPGLYTTATGLLISTSVTLSGNANDVWIFQIGQDLTVGNGVNVILGGDAQARNIFWQVAGLASLGTTSHFEGTILSQTAITLDTLASMNGRALAQTAVNLDHSTVTKP